MAQTERERKVQERTMKVVRNYGGYVYKNAQGMYTEKGRPDLAACIPAKLSTLVKMYGEDAMIGLFVGLEIKRDCEHGYGTSDAQEIVGRKIQKAHGLWFALDNPDLIEALMIKLGGTTNVIQ